MPTRFHHQIAHQAAARVAVPADFAFARLGSADCVGGWALGSMDLMSAGDGVWRGRSLFDGAAAHVEILPDPTSGLIDFAVGTAEMAPWPRSTSAGWARRPPRAG